MKGFRIGAGRPVSKCEFSCPLPLDVEDGATRHHLLWVIHKAIRIDIELAKDSEMSVIWIEAVESIETRTRGAEHVERPVYALPPKLSTPLKIHSRYRPP
jgi:hypothetical protein